MTLGEPPESSGERADLGHDLSSAAIDALIGSLVKIPGVGVAIMSGQGTILWANEEIRRLYLDNPHAEIIGLNAAELFPKAWVEERLRMLQSVLATGKGVALREIWHGRQFVADMRPISDGTGRASEVLVISRPVEGTDLSEYHDGECLQGSQFVELGPLSVLTPCELMVLALIGQGLTLKEMAAALHRSVKTVDNHRTSIGRKLREANRIALAKIAAQAGLRVDDAQLKRVRAAWPQSARKSD